MWIIRVCYYWKQPNEIGYRAYDVILPRAYEALKNLEKNYTIVLLFVVIVFAVALCLFFIGLGEGGNDFGWNDPF